MLANLLIEGVPALRVRVKTTKKLLVVLFLGLTFSWNYENSTLQPNEVIEVIFSLQVDSEVSGIDSFSFDMILIANRGS